MQHPALSRPPGVWNGESFGLVWEIENSERIRLRTSGETELQEICASDRILSEFQTICVVVTERNTISHEA
jgi:hypothetical protein